MDILKKLCAVHAPSGNEVLMKNFILKYIGLHQHKWAVKPKLFYDNEFQDCIIAVFGKPRTAIFTHMDSIGFTVRYNNELVPIGSPDVEAGYELSGQDELGHIEGTIQLNENGSPFCQFNRSIERGTELVFKADFKEESDFIQSPYLDNRLGVYAALRLMEDLQDGIIAFSCWEEHGGGSVPFLGKFIYENYKVSQALIADITWVTEGVHAGEGAVISLRDRGIPRKSFLNKIIGHCKTAGLEIQLEVEGSGGSDGRELQQSAYPWDWCFIGAPELNAHTPFERVHKNDIKSMIEVYKHLMKVL